MSAATVSPLVREPDQMGVWSDIDALVWLPRSRYPKRSDAIRFALDTIGFVHWTDVRCLSRWMRWDPSEAPEEAAGDWWVECKADAPGAFRVWRLEKRRPSNMRDAATTLRDLVDGLISPRDARANLRGLAMPNEAAELVKRGRWAVAGYPTGIAGAQMAARQALDEIERP